jgi:hypothetical protein
MSTYGGGEDKIMKTTKIEEYTLFMLATLKKLQVTVLNVLPFVYTL